MSNPTNYDDSASAGNEAACNSGKNTEATEPYQPLPREEPTIGQEEDIPSDGKDVVAEKMMQGLAPAVPGNAPAQK